MGTRYIGRAGAAMLLAAGLGCCALKAVGAAPTVGPTRRAAGAARAGGGRKPASPSRRVPAPKLPANAPPAISLTSRVPEFQRAETRLARFIKALQEGDRVRAASLLSSRVPARDRAALLSGSWLRRRPGATLRRDFEQVLFTADLQIRTSAKMYRNQVHLSVMPRTLAIHEKPKQLGFLDVPMRKERGQWWVDLRRGRI